MISNKSLRARFAALARGEWLQLLRASAQCDEKAALARRRRRGGDDVGQRATRVETLIQLGELSSARQALEGSELAPGTRALTDERRHPALPRAPLPADMMHYQTDVPSSWTRSCSGRTFDHQGGAQQGRPSGMTSEHLRPLLSDTRGMKLLFTLGENLSRGHVAPSGG